MKINADLYIKDTDRNQYLNYTSSHHNHTKRFSVCSQALNVRRISKYTRNEIMVSEKRYPKRLLMSKWLKLGFLIKKKK